MFQRYRQLIPILLFAAVCISTIITAISGLVTVTLDNIDYKITLGAKHYEAIIFVTATLISFFIFRKYYKYFFIITLILGVVGLINFTLSELSMGLTFGDVHVGMSPILIAVGIITYLLNQQRVNSALLALIKPSEKMVVRFQQEEVDDFRDRFARKSSEEFKKIVAVKKLVPSAISTAQQLLQERH